MPRKISFINELTDEAAIMAAEYCPLCGAEKGDHDKPRTVLDAAEIVRSLAEMLLEDQTAFYVVMYFVRNPLETVHQAAEKLNLSNGSICAARQRAAKRYPSMAAILGLKSTRAIAQQTRFSA